MEERWKPTEEIEVGERSLQVFCILPFFMSEIIKTNLGSFDMKAKKYRLIAGKEKGERYGEKEKSVDVSVLSQKIIGSEGTLPGVIVVCPHCGASVLADVDETGIADPNRAQEIFQKEVAG